MKYDFLIVGAGLFGAVMANRLKEAGKKCLVIEKRSHIAGNIYSKEEEGIQVHKYGAHIFHTSDKQIWEYVNQFASFNNYINSPVAIYGDEVYNLPFNMNTFHKMWGVVTPQQAMDKIIEQRSTGGVCGEPSNLEEQAIALVGKDIYFKLVKGYTEKQWGCSCTELPAFIIKRLPVRFTYDNNYFNDRYQGIPEEGYTKMVERMFDGIQVCTETEFRNFLDSDLTHFQSRDGKDTFDKVIYTGMIDEFFDYRLGNLAYRSLRFETEILPECDNFQGNAVVNYTEREIPYTRIIEHKHFTFSKQKGTVITREYPAEWRRGEEPYYPVNDEKNAEIYQKYRALAETIPNLYFGGRLGQYRYFDMDKVIASALEMYHNVV